MTTGMHLSQLADVVAEQDRLEEALTLKLEAVTQVTAAYDLMLPRYKQSRAEAEKRGMQTAGPLSRRSEMSVRRDYGELLRRARRLAEAESVYQEVLVMQAAEAERPAGMWPYSPVIGRAYRAASRAEQRSAVLAGLAAVLRDADRQGEAELLAAEVDSLAADAAKLRARINRVAQKRAQTQRARVLITIEELQRLLNTPFSGNPVPA